VLRDTGYFLLLGIPDCPACVKGVIAEKYPARRWFSPPTSLRGGAQRLRRGPSRSLAITKAARLPASPS
jgi:hypothetical protein